MKSTLKIAFTILSLIGYISTVSGQNLQMDTILNRYQEYLFRTEDTEPEEIMILADALNSEGKWPDINYRDSSLASWKTANHLKRIRKMALAWANPINSTHHNNLVKEKIDLALRHWLEKKYQNSNWWHNEIGVPRYMRDIIILLRNDLSNEDLNDALDVMGQSKVREDFVGGNLIWCADLGLHYGALIDDDKLVRRCRKLIVDEIKLGTGEGIQTDYSFHQHGQRLQMYQYGKAYLWESIRIAWQLKGTPIAFPQEKINVLTDFLTEGWQWMARGVNTVPGTMDRSSSRKGELRSADIRKLLPFIIELQPSEADRLKKLKSIQDGDSSLAGHRYYPRSDFMAYHHKDFSFFLKTISTRTLPTQSINNENLKGKLLNSGDAYLIRNGREYFDLLPVWDWTALPGITAFKNAHEIERKAFVGSVSDKTSGLSVMDYVLKNSTSDQLISAKKFWACYQDMIVCLIGDLQAENIQGSVYTVLDQCRWQGDVRVNQLDRTLTKGVNTFDKVKWIHHSGFAYIPLKNNAFEIHLGEVKGKWTNINAFEIDTPLSEKVFKLVMLHPSKKSSSGYVLSLSETPEDAKQLAENPKWEILSNTKNCQAVRFNDGIVMIAYYTPSTLEIEKGYLMKVDQPCLVILKENKIHISDPSQNGGSVNIAIGNRKMKVNLPEDGSTMTILLDSE